MAEDNNDLGKYFGTLGDRISFGLKEIVSGVNNVGTGINNVTKETKGVKRGLKKVENKIDNKLTETIKNSKEDFKETLKNSDKKFEDIFNEFKDSKSETYNGPTSEEYQEGVEDTIEEQKKSKVEFTGIKKILNNVSKIVPVIGHDFEKTSSERNELNKNLLNLSKQSKFSLQIAQKNIGLLKDQLNILDQNGDEYKAISNVLKTLEDEKSLKRLDKINENLMIGRKISSSDQNFVAKTVSGLSDDLNQISSVLKINLGDLVSKTKENLNNNKLNIEDRKKSVFELTKFIKNNKVSLSEDQLKLFKEIKDINLDSLNLTGKDFDNLIGKIDVFQKSVEDVDIESTFSKIQSTLTKTLPSKKDLLFVNKTLKKKDEVKENTIVTTLKDSVKTLSSGLIDNILTGVGLGGFGLGDLLTDNYKSIFEGTKDVITDTFSLFKKKESKPEDKNKGSTTKTKQKLLPYFPVNETPIEMGGPQKQIPYFPSKMKQISYNPIEEKPIELGPTSVLTKIKEELEKLPENLAMFFEEMDKTSSRETGSINPAILVGAVESIEDVVYNVEKKFKGMITTANTSLSQFSSSLKDSQETISKTFNSTKEFFKKTIPTQFKTFFKGLGTKFSEFLDSMEGSGGGGILSTLLGALGLGGVASKGGKLAKGALKIGTGILGGAKTASGFIAKKAPSLLQTGAKVASKASPLLKVGAKSLSKFVPGLSGIMEFADSKMSGQKTSKAVTRGVGAGVGSLAGGALGLLGGPAGALLGSAIGGYVGNFVAEQAYDFVEGDGLGKLSKKIKSGFSSVKDVLVKVFSSDFITTKVKEFFGSLFDAVKDFFTGGATDMVSSVKNFFSEKLGFGGDKKTTTTPTKQTVAPEKKTVNTPPKTASVLKKANPEIKVASIDSSAKNFPKVEEARKQNRQQNLMKMPRQNISVGSGFENRRTPIVADINDPAILQGKTFLFMS